METLIVYPVTCLKCEHKNEITDAWVGYKYTCPQCNKQFEIEWHDDKGVWNDPIKLRGENRLKPCPFCSASGDKIKYEFSGSQGRIVCMKCSTYGPEVEESADPICDVEAAENAWNKRTCDNDKYSNLKLNYW